MENRTSQHISAQGNDVAMEKSGHPDAREITVTTVLVIALLILGAYLFQAGGILGPDTLDVAAVLAATPAPGSELIQVFFTTPAFPDDAADNLGGLDLILVEDIARARQSVAVAAYELDLETVADALVGAHNRGVEVRFVTDSDNVDEPAVQRMDGAGIPIVEDDRSAIMHNKFVILDGEVLWTGSWNLTENGTYRNNNNAVRIVSPQLAKNYLVEFEEMFEHGAFGRTSPSNTPDPEITLTDPVTGEQVRLGSFFAPEDGVSARILSLVEGAQESVRFLAFSFTDDTLGEAVKQQSKAGRLVQGVFEARGADTEYSEYGRMRRARPPLDVVIDGNPYIMHHKVFILDEETVVLGSYNFTENADKVNDENLLIVQDRGVAALFLEEFAQIYRQGKSAGR
jgi:phosphatidylserine/phosphatidylglycerophosphate/cardiolipin synthase-like enzyme